LTGSLLHLVKPINLKIPAALKPFSENVKFTVHAIVAIIIFGKASYYESKTSSWHIQKYQFVTQVDRFRFKYLLDQYTFNDQE
jgi:hypothetical protein